MGGKASIFLVVGFSLIFIVAGNNFNNLTIKSTTNSADYYDLEVIDNIANSGINFAISSIRRDPDWTPESNDGNNESANFNFSGGSFEVDVQKSASISTITATATYKDRSKIVEVKLRMPKFSEFAYFSDKESSDNSKIYWYNTDTVWGPFHTNGDLNCAYKPWFLGNSTTYGGNLNLLTKNHELHAPHIAGHYEKKTINFPTDGVSNLATLAADNGAHITGKPQVYIEFAGDNIMYKYNESDSYTTVEAEDFAPNNTIFIEDGELHIKGTVSGNWSIGCSGNGTTKIKTGTVKGKPVFQTYEKGSVFIDDDIVYNDNIDFFDKNDASNDLLGIVAKQDVLISDNNETKNVNIHAAIFCEEGGFGAENYESRSKDGSIYLKGGITQKIRKAVGTFSGTNILSGYSKNYRYDARLERIFPPSYPDTKQFVVVSWLDTIVPEEN